MSVVRLAAVAPRLAAGRRALWPMIGELEAAILRTGQLVEHRELQLIRAMGRSGRGAGVYCAQRRRKLDDAKAARARYERRLARLL